MLLLLSLFSPLVEAFPNLYMSWWAPSNGNLQEYLATWRRRVAVVLVVWLPILINLEKISEPGIIALVISVLVFSAFGFRLHTFDRFLRLEIKKGHSINEPSKIPEFLYFVAFLSIGALLYRALPDAHWMVPAAICSIFLGAFMMSRFRRGKHKNFKLDIVGRFVFVGGFLLNLYHLSVAVSIVNL